MGQYTYLRIRITSAAAGMTTSHATGYFTNGEVEDYRVLIVDRYPLSLTNFSFDATLVDNKYAKLHWAANEDNNFAGYEIEKSKDSRTWENAGLVASNGHAGQKNYEFNDYSPYTGTTYYRIKFVGVSGNDKYSEIRTVKKINLSDRITIWPNPVTTTVGIGIESSENTIATVMISSSGGKHLFLRKYPVYTDANTITIPVENNWPSGMYMIRVIMGNEITDKKLIILK